MYPGEHVYDVDVFIVTQVVKYKTSDLGSAKRSFQHVFPARNNVDFARNKYSAKERRAMAAICLFKGRSISILPAVTFPRSLLFCSVNHLINQTQSPSIIHYTQRLTCTCTVSLGHFYWERTHTQRNEYTVRGSNLPRKYPLLLESQ